MVLEVLGIVWVVVILLETPWVPIIFWEYVHIKVMSVIGLIYYIQA